MRNYKKLAAATLAISFSFLGSNIMVNNNVSLASEEKNAPIANLEITQSNAPYQESVVKLNQDDTTRQQVLDQLKAIRSKAWDDNVTLEGAKDGRTATIRDVANYYYPKGNPSKEDYVNKYEYSLELEHLALQRAYELTLTGDNQLRPDGSSYETIAYKDLRLGTHDWVCYDSGEEISTEKLFDTILYNKDKKGENGYQRLIDENGAYDGNESVYNMLIYSPPRIGVGYGQVENPKTGKSAAVIAFDDKDPFFFLDKVEKVDYVGDYTMSFGNPNLKKSSKESLDELEKAIEDAKETIKGAKILMDKMPNFSKKHGDELNQLIEEENKLIDKAEAILKANCR